MALRLLLPALVLAALVSAPAGAQCPAKPPLLYYTAGAYTPCLCLVPGEEAGVVFTPPAGDYPLEVLGVNIRWGSQVGGAPQMTEQGIHLYNGGLPNPGPRIATLPGPMLTDGVLNVFAFPTPVPVNAGPITATLEMLNNVSGGTIFTPSVVWDGDGCQPGVNVVKVIPGGWNDACPLGVAGDWGFELVYRPCQTPVPARETTWGAIKRIHAGSLRP